MNKATPAKATPATLILAAALLLNGLSGCGGVDNGGGDKKADNKAEDKGQVQTASPNDSLGGPAPDNNSATNPSSADTLYSRSDSTQKPRSKTRK